MSGGAGNGQAKETLTPDERLNETERLLAQPLPEALAGVAAIEYDGPNSRLVNGLIAAALRVARGAVQDGADLATLLAQPYATPKRLDNNASVVDVDEHETPDLALYGAADDYGRALSQHSMADGSPPPSIPVAARSLKSAALDYAASVRGATVGALTDDRMSHPARAYAKLVLGRLVQAATKEDRDAPNKLIAELVQCRDWTVDRATLDRLVDIVLLAFDDNDLDVVAHVASEAATNAIFGRLADAISGLADKQEAV